MGEPRRPWVRVDDGGYHPVVWMGNAELEVGIVPALGGRLLSVRVGGREILWRNDELLDERLQPRAGHRPAPHAGELSAWMNYGGDKTWPAPQGWSTPTQWAGPPDPILDSGVYDFDTTRGGEYGAESVSTTVTSGSDARTGLTLTRRFTITDDDSLLITLTGTNTSDRPVRWALWNVTQLVGGAEVRVDVDDATVAPLELIAGSGIPRWNRSAPESITVPAQDVVGKLGFTRACGTMHYRHEDVSVGWEFDVHPDGDYPDGGSRVEVWLECPQPQPLAELGGLNPPDRIVECEVLGPLRDLQPGESMTQTIRMTSEVSTDDVRA